MNKFLINTLGFVIIPFAILFSIYFINYRKIEKQIKSIAVNSSIILMGDSEVQRINPDYFKQRTFNFSAPGESYLVTYYKLLKVLSFKNHNVKTVILGCSIHNFGPVFIPCYDIKSNQGAQTLKSSMYYSKIFNDSIFFSTRDFIGERNFYLGIFESPKLNGFYKSTNREPSTDIIEKTLQEHYKSNLEYRINDFYHQQFYLKKIIDLCELNKLNLYLLSTPLHKYYKDNIPNVFSENFKKLMKQLNVKHLDYLNDDIKNEYMSDGNHLNIEGSTVYSKLISQTVAEELNRNSK